MACRSPRARRGRDRPVANFSRGVGQAEHATPAAASSRAGSFALLAIATRASIAAARTAAVLLLSTSTSGLIAAASLNRPRALITRGWLSTLEGLLPQQIGECDGGLLRPDHLDRLEGRGADRLGGMSVPEHRGQEVESIGVSQLAQRSRDRTLDAWVLLAREQAAEKLARIAVVGAGHAPDSRRADGSRRIGGQSRGSPS